MRLLLIVFVAWVEWTVVRATWLHHPLHAIAATVLAIAIDVVIFSWRGHEAG